MLLLPQNPVQTFISNASANKYLQASTSCIAAARNAAEMKDYAMKQNQ